MNQFLMKKMVMKGIKREMERSVSGVLGETERSVSEWNWLRLARRAE